jgi:hypothetical protein
LHSNLESIEKGKIMNHGAMLQRGLLAVLTAGLFGLAFAAQAADNDGCMSCAASNASAKLPEASGMIVQGSLNMVKGSGLLLVESVTAAGEGSVVVLKGASEGISVSVRVSADVARQLSTAVGTSVQVVATSTGNLLVMSGKAIAFIPNEIGLALLHQNKLD